MSTYTPHKSDMLLPDYKDNYLIDLAYQTRSVWLQTTSILNSGK